MTAYPSHDADCIVIGSGPAGVSVAFPLVESRLQVLMIDGAARDQTAGSRTDSLWKRMLGSKLEALLPEDGLSPKLRTPSARKLANDFGRDNRIHGDGFVAIGSLARGGLSQIWGGLVCEFDVADIADWPVPIEELRTSYKCVSQRVGVSGSDCDEMADFFGRSTNILPPPALGSAASKLFSRYDPGSQGSAFGLGLARNAILTTSRDDREACDLRKGCLWGCPKGAIYDARFDLAMLERNANFRLIDGARAIRLERLSHDWKVYIQDGRTLTAPRILLAAGTLGTIALVIPLLPNLPSDLTLLNNPVAVVPLLMLSQLGRPPFDQGHLLAQLGYRYRFGTASTDYVTGAVYEVEALPASCFTARMPLSRRGGTEFFRAFAPALLVTTCYFPGSYSHNAMRWASLDDHVSIVVHGGSKADLKTRFKEVTNQLRKIWWQLGAVMLPGGSLALPGTDGHYAGPFGMGFRSDFGTSMWGELNAAPGVYVVGSAAFPTLPSKHSTLTIMANADRIGRYLARRVCSMGS